MSEQITGGTSAVVPALGGLLALANQARTTPGLIGYPNPAIYAIGKDPAKYMASFRDIKDGSSSGAACDGTQYSAAAGYDQVDRLGDADVRIHRDNQQHRAQAGVESGWGDYRSRSISKVAVITLERSPFR